MVFWRQRLWVVASFHSSIVAFMKNGQVDDSKTIRLAQTDWCWGLAVNKEDRLLVTASPPYDFQRTLPAANSFVNKKGHLFECDFIPGGSPAILPVAQGLTRPGGLDIAPKTHPAYPGDVFLTEYGNDRHKAGRVLRLTRPQNAPIGTPYEKHIFIDLADILHKTNIKPPPDTGEEEQKKDERRDPGLVHPWALCFSPSGDDLFVSTDPNDSQVLRFDSRGHFLDRISFDGSETPNSLCCA